MGTFSNKALGLSVDRRDLPVYGVSEAARYLGVPESTMKSWVFGRAYVTVSGESRTFRPLIEPADPNGQRELSFFNIVEAHVLLATRKVHGISLENIRNAIDYVREQFPANAIHPLITQEFHTDGKDLFIKSIEETVNASRKGQLAFRELVNAHLELIDRDVYGMPVKLYPKRGNRAVVINPSLSSGRPVVRGTGVLASIIAQRVESGERTSEIAQNYGVPESDIVAAIEYAKAA